MKKILSFAASLLVLTSAFTCGKEKESEIVSLKGTQWRLVGFVDVQTGSLTEVIPTRGAFVDHKLIDGDPFDCEKCYTLKFEIDNEAGGWTILNGIRVIFHDPISFSSANISFSEKPLIFGTDIGEPPTPTLYREALNDLTSYTCYNDELKLFYNNNKNYLLYKPIEQ